MDNLPGPPNKVISVTADYLKSLEDERFTGRKERSRLRFQLWAAMSLAVLFVTGFLTFGALALAGEFEHPDRPALYRAYAKEHVAEYVTPEVIGDFVYKHAFVEGCIVDMDVAFDYNQENLAKATAAFIAEVEARGDRIVGTVREIPATSPLVGGRERPVYMGVVVTCG